MYARAYACRHNSLYVLLLSATYFVCEVCTLAYEYS